MQLKPVSRVETSTYPTKAPRRGWSRKLSTGFAALCVTAAMSLTGCLEIGPQEERLAGAARATWFECSVEAPAPKNLVDMNMLVGDLCNEETAWASFQVDEAGMQQLELVGGAEAAIVTVISPSGEEVGELSSDETSLMLELSTGVWTLAVTPADPDNPWGYFEVSVAPVGDLAS